MTDDKANILNLIADIEILIRKGKRQLALERIAALRKEIEKHG